jgi:2-(1,2-epoxy-1,2-dihydrophenyl)acetyl-CoA isomerase
MTSPTSPVVVRRDGPVATVELNRPHRLNALDEPMRAALLASLTALAADDAVRVLVLTGAGRAFCVGQDLAATGELADAHDTVARTYNPLVRAIVAMGKPVVAAVNGPAVGAGMGLALACDIVLMAGSATLSCAFGKVALVPDSGTAWVLARRLGRARAFDLATTGRRVGAEEAVALGLANEVLADDELRPAAAKRAADLAAGPAVTLALTKRLLVSGGEQPLDQVLEMEALGQGRAAATDEHVALRTAFLDRR